MCCGPSPHFTLFQELGAPAALLWERSLWILTIPSTSSAGGPQTPFMSPPPRDKRLQMKAAALENGSISDLWISFKEHLIPYSTGEFRGTASNKLIMKLVQWCSDSDAVPVVMWSRGCDLYNRRRLSFLAGRGGWRLQTSLTFTSSFNETVIVFCVLTG